MRKLKLQMNLALNNKWDSGMSDFSIDNLKNVDCILHGRKTAEGFIPYWTAIANNPNDAEYKLGRRFADIPNAVFSNTLKVSPWDNTKIIGGDIKAAIEALKKKNGEDILVYGGDSFVSSLIQHDLIDEFCLLVNPAEIGNGQQTFNPLKNDLELKLVSCKPFACGAALLYYTRA
ncbi:dihydrofolate reductase family protein [Mucilaginibacter sp. NFR10]|uniref:dihydrofolate reductase family protein n=1 Tax=Mucilaginibacter sp. NFR10 TaxID=1566292 RepID=UPI0008712380|nr:dihydrofolate reductase family protein [Mucilaginibacter sp. NFR10]SCW74903.1 RibD C-terminal domain-containing protein [Mucilaginibacter sp. NFR10]